VNSKEQLAILDVRGRVLKIVDSDDGQLDDRLRRAAPDITLLAQLLVNWVDNTAIKYKSAGCEQEEWRDDIRQWFVQNQFYVDEHFQSAMWKVHLSHMGWGRHVILTFKIV
jgi:hypothetical protein